MDLALRIETTICNNGSDYDLTSRPCNLRIDYFTPRKSLSFKFVQLSLLFPGAKRNFSKFNLCFTHTVKHRMP